MLRATSISAGVRMNHGTRRIRDKIKSKWGGGAFHALPRDFVKSSVVMSLGPYASKLFLDLVAQYSGFNNGDLTIAWRVMKKRGWRSKATLEKATAELIGKGLILRTRQGTRHRCHLYALTIYSIDECEGKMDINPTVAPPKLWLKFEPVIPIPEAQEKLKAFKKEGRQYA